MKSTAKFAILLTITAAVAACGGGGGAAAPAGDTSAAAPAPAPGPTPVLAAPSPANYAAGSEEANAFSLLNQERTKCGFGALQQDARLDQAAAAHASYLVENGFRYGHFEAAGLPGFTGVTEGDRVKAAGYLGAVGASLATSSGPLPATGTLRTTKQIRGLMAAPYHLLSLVDAYADLGIGYVAKALPSEEKKALNLTLGLRAGVNDLAADQVYTYPCNGSTGVNPGLADETPSPIPVNLTQNYRLFGAPIAVKVRKGKALALASATIVATDGGRAVASQIVMQGNDPQGGVLMRGDSAYILPLAPLIPATSYTVTFAGTSDGVSFSKSIVFSTGN